MTVPLKIRAKKWKENAAIVPVLALWIVYVGFFVVQACSYWPLAVIAIAHFVITCVLVEMVCDLEEIVAYVMVCLLSVILNQGFFFLLHVLKWMEKLDLTRDWHILVLLAGLSIAIACICGRCFGWFVKKLA